MSFSIVRTGLLTMTSIVMMLATAGAVSPTAAAPTIASGVHAKNDKHVTHRDLVRDMTQTSPQPNSDVVPKPQPIPYVQLGTSGDNALWVNEALAELHYLPVTFQPAAGSVPAPSAQADSATSSSQGSAIATTGNISASSDQAQSPATIANDSAAPTSPAACLAAGVQSGHLTPLQGTWTWNAAYPASLTSLWNPSVANVITQGAIIHFQHQLGLDIDGIAGPQVYHALLVALTSQQMSTAPYVYVTVSKTSPEHLDVWQVGQKVYSTPANTGISACPTPDGTWPVYSRLTSQTMQGTDPSGQKYYDPGVPWISYFYQGCAIHGYPRASYGSPQSLGCVELPLSNAEAVYNLLDYGTLVTVGP